MAKNKIIMMLNIEENRKNPKISKKKNNAYIEIKIDTIFEIIR